MASILPASWEIPTVFHQRMGEKVGRQRSMFHENHLLVVLHEVPEPGVPEREGVFFWRSPHGQWKTNLSGAGLPALRALVNRYAARVDNLRDRAGEIERAAELLNDEAKTALEYEIAEAAEAQTKTNTALALSGQRLNLLAAMFLPLTAIASPWASPSASTSAAASAAPRTKADPAHYCGLPK